jgi:Cu(I)/Ag(I) efflux system membrane fusion protein
VIASLTIREGGYLSPAQSALSAGPIDEVWVDADVFERQSQWVSIGDEATMRLDALPGKEWQGKVDYIYPILNQNTRTLKVRLKFANQDRALKPNMFANISLQPHMGEPVLTVPREAIIRSGGMTRVVLALGEGKYRSARVEAGRESEGRIEILACLQAHDLVVTSAQFLLDSESSQSADLSRINGVEKASDQAWIDGRISMLMADFGMITIEHQAVSQWGWDSGEMNFTVGEDVSLGEYSEGEAVRFLVEKHDDQFALTQLQKAGGAQ